MASNFRWLIWVGLIFMVLVSFYKSLSSPDTLPSPLSQGRETTASPAANADVRDEEDDSGEYQPYEPDSSFIPQTLIDAEKNTTDGKSYNDFYAFNEAEVTKVQAPFSCRPKIPNRAKTRTPLIVFTMEHAGSDLLFRLLRETALISSPANSAKINTRKSNNDKQRHNVHLLNMNELFAAVPDTDHSDRLWSASMALAENCMDRDLVHLKQNLQSQWVSKKVTAKDPSETISFLRGLGPSSVNGMLETLHDHRRSNMVGALEYIKQLPDCFAEQSVVAVKILDRHLYPQIDPAAFVANLHRQLHGKIHFVILWRRRLIDAYVAQEKKKLKRQSSTTSNNNWSKNNSTTLPQSPTDEPLVEVKLAEFEQYMSEKQKYFKTLRDQFQRLNIPYQVLEYERDLTTREETMQRIQQVMLWETSVTSNRPASHKVLSTSPSQKKRAQSLPLHRQISNWQQVSSWGYKDWPDLFSTVAEEEERAATARKEQEEQLTKSLH